jgi:hypothetical protein
VEEAMGAGPAAADVIGTYVALAEHAKLHGIVASHLLHKPLILKSQR